METIPWFEHDDGELGSAQREFAAVLAARAAAWQVDALSTVLLPPRHTPYGEMLACLDIEDPERGRIVLTIAAHFDGTTVRADKVHNQNFTLPETRTEFAFTTTGTPAKTAHRTATWFEAVLARPLVRCEWLHEGKVYALRYEYADNGLGLSEGFTPRLAPPELRERLAAEGVDHGRGRINRAGLGEPDRVVPVRGVRASGATR
ncbi:hypothetical protein E2C00_17365 [Streptomyces sp. WAC05374]|uniref:hypothetical protein n=1 Tax=Streptomyces sp. WAC05374 TaxID=2487420 RepID=UPI000F868F27|nr:hypothetical protein [Streptomyces sp. WAC05374]RST16474.1 hypothetical protein EF905_12120 [Streptomyces sp. WAC05374]TDF54680.1 hypothetical protein E2C00_17365 [Streptomyces sp. WAC05374]TDF56316.1 hypothetical protein E2C02_12820 [Streptomyces sp. WAC05374]